MSSEYIVNYIKIGIYVFDKKKRENEVNKNNEYIKIILVECDVMGLFIILLELKY